MFHSFIITTMLHSFNITPSMINENSHNKNEHQVGARRAKVRFRTSQNCEIANSGFLLTRHKNRGGEASIRTALSLSRKSSGILYQFHQNAPPRNEKMLQVSTKSQTTAMWKVASLEWNHSKKHHVIK